MVPTKSMLSANSQRFWHQMTLSLSTVPARSQAGRQSVLKVERSLHKRSCLFMAVCGAGGPWASLSNTVREDNLCHFSCASRRGTNSVSSWLFMLKLADLLTLQWEQEKACVSPLDAFPCIEFETLPSETHLRRKCHPHRCWRYLTGEPSCLVPRVMKGFWILLINFPSVWLFGSSRVCYAFVKVQ